ncbi:uncharacterized protein LOC106465549 [Limulus polyphemus]|uniref:Uncharacterized protein LOC106465549 n=1 Tax=Limulus polyphemus TaxID=6850 RepID=A0ABM1BFY5_LIMPO|nr:uncharacterized protein LOC106465549 [Limulus polyphemus]
MAKILYVLGFLLTVATYQVYSQSCHMRELDVCAASLLVNQEDNIAQTEAELDTQCATIRDVQHCIQNYTQNCMTAVQRELMGFFSEGSERLLEDYCTSGTDVRKRYLENSACLSEANKETRHCLTDLRNGLEVIGTSEFDKRVPTACCSYQRYMECVEKTVEDKCGADSVTFLQELLRTAVSRLPDIVCTGYSPESEECVKVLPEPGQEPSGSSSSPLSRLFDAYFQNLD